VKWYRWITKEEQKGRTCIHSGISNQPKKEFAKSLKENTTIVKFELEK
jgi:hypothetical protein